LEKIPRDSVLRMVQFYLTARESEEFEAGADTRPLFGST
jgi:hypothetical protein